MTSSARWKAALRAAGIAAALALAPALAPLALPGAARAQVVDLAQSKCLAGKVKAVSRSAAARARCLAKAAARGAAPGACLEKASRRFTGGERPAKAPFAKLERRGACPTEGDAAALEGGLAGLVHDLEAVVGAAGRSRCDAARLKCLAKYLGGTLGCAAKGAKKAGAVDPACYEARASALTDPARGCWEKALRKGDCSLFSEAAAARALGEAFAQEALCALDPGAGPGCGANPLDVFLPPGALSLVGVSKEAFQPLDATLRFVLVGAEFSPYPEDVDLRVNGSGVSPASLSLAPGEITAMGVLQEGRNDVVLAAVDAFGRPLHLHSTLWAGSETLTVALVDELGAPFLFATDVVAALGDDRSVGAEVSTSDGTASFENLPDRTILVHARTADNDLGAAGFVGSQGSVELTVRGFEPPSPIANNDLGQGLDGWNVAGAAHVEVVPHVEGNPEPIPPPPPLSLAPQALDPRGAGDGDLLLYSDGFDAQTVSRTFDTAPGTSSVRLRYRFQTSEVPGGFFGTEFNDYFSVTIRSRFAGDSVTESNSMNGMGLEAFDPTSGAAEWRDVTLEVDPAGDTIQVDLTVSNVSDDRWGSLIAVDFVGEDDNQVWPRLAWNETDGGLDLFYRVDTDELTVEGAVEVYFASGPGWENRIGAPLLTFPVPAGTPVGEHGPFPIRGGLLRFDPERTSHLIAASGENNVGAIPDARIAFGPNANQEVVWGGMREIVRDGLRIAGEPTGTITSTARTPADQARAMFHNLVNPAHTIAENIAIQKGIYAAPGDAVIDTFAAETAGLTRDQILANRTAVQATMQARIEELGPSNVSRHCGDPAERSVVDVLAAVFSASNAPVFTDAVRFEVTRFIDERATNNCYHLELQ